MRCSSCLQQGSVEIEAALWSAVRALKRTRDDALARDCDADGNAQSAKGYHDRATEARTQADVARQFMVDLLQPK